MTLLNIDALLDNADWPKRMAATRLETLARRFASTQLNLPPDLADALLAYGREIPNYILTEDGREDEPHVTVKYGLPPEISLMDVRRVIQGFGAVTLTLGLTGIFSNADADVLQINVEGEALRQLNALLAGLPGVTDTQPSYHPHATIAYLKPGRGVHYTGDNRFVGQTVTIDRLLMSYPDGRQILLPLEDARSLAAKPRPMHVVADAHEAAFTKALQDAFDAGRKAIAASLRSATTEAEALSALDQVPGAVAASLHRSLLPLVARTQINAAEFALNLVPHQHPRRAAAKAKAVPPLTMRFDATNPHVVAWAQSHVAEAIKNISETTADDLRDIVSQVFEDGDLREAYDQILDAVGDSARATMIARTEAMTAANEGQRAGWRQAVDDDLLSDEMQRVWIATDGSCDECQDLDGETAPLDGEYDGDGGDGPPLHPNCRCTEGLTNA